MLRQVLARSTPNSRLPSLVNLAIVCGDQGKLAEAEGLFREALAAAPDEPRILEPFAAFLADHGLKLEEALSFAQTAAKQMPDNPDVLDTLGWIQLKRGLLVEAEKTLNKGLEKAGDAPPASKIRDHLKQLKNLKNK